MKKFLTISAVVFLMVFTAGFATAKKVPFPVFPFTGTGDVFSVTNTGTLGGATVATITVNNADGLFWGTLVFGAITVEFSAVEDSSGVFTLNGIETIGGSAIVQGAFIIAKEKEPGIKGKIPAVAIQFRILGVPGTPSYAGFLYQ
ncbi:MAG: hypothetical protein ACLQDI_04000 [Syntrophobacteraceae bacterium]